jgi:uncharacterized protein (UPF0335 family)
MDVAALIQILSSDYPYNAKVTSATVRIKCDSGRRSTLTIRKPIAGTPETEAPRRHVVTAVIERIEVTEEDKKALINAIINDYHTTRLSGTDAATHILTKWRTTKAFDEFIGLVAGDSSLC